MRGSLLASASAVAFGLLPAAVSAQATAQPQDEVESETETTEEISPTAQRAAPAEGNEIIVTATRREARLQDVPVSVTAFSQEELTEKGIVGYERLARETPGVVLNRPTQNFNNFTARGISTNGYSAGLQAPVAIYIDELPISANGNSTILDPNLYDVERVEFLRGPQGTLFGSGSLAGAMRIITKAPNPSEFEASALVDLGYTEEGGLRQRYNAMVNVPIAQDKVAFRAVGYYRNEDGWVDNIGTGIDDANSIEAYGIRASLLIEPSSRFSVRLSVNKEISNPADSSLTNPDLGTYVRRTAQPDLFQSDLLAINATINADFGFAELVSSTTYSDLSGLFYVDLAGTYDQLVPFSLDALGYDDIIVQEVRLASSHEGPFEWIVGGFFFDKRRNVDFDYRTTPEFLAQTNTTGLPSIYYQSFKNYTDIGEKAVFGELTYRFSDSLWVTGGLRYGEVDVQTTTRGGGYTSNFLTRGFCTVFRAQCGFFVPPLTVTDTVPSEGVLAKDDKLSWKGSISFKPSRNLTTYATVSTGFRPPVVNARAGLVPPAAFPNDIVIPEGASSDKLTNYEVGLKGSFFDNRFTANLAAFYIDWNNIQVQANRVSDAVQFATNIGGAVSKGIEFELVARPVDGLRLAASGAYIDARIDDLSPVEAAISGAEDGIRLATPEFQGSATATYSFPVGDTETAFVTGNVAYVGSFPGLFPNVPGQPGVQSPQYDFTEEYVYANAYAGVNLSPDLSITAYVENVFNNDAINYVHPEAFLDGRYGRLRPRTFGVRTNITF
ncbi:TonB-dependent receptor [Alteriqipengyuania lutimaris]|uniref:TonB-dependent receptor n=1 Tax=Alteriqipengyuania lutimaris TaxID=1538146 RepID=A0A395LVA1_9SPHN|nr:TonB-dependent receptor [Alteriqipengyuania lutimaris]MBB3032516.1 outer membrane receptor protein involved in Fe transport [Alteriqipengyuania lutimaris]RDS78350.1 TonB-dependent receptor [Alteriqipengyuania lutimaris]